MHVRPVLRAVFYALHRRICARQPQRIDELFVSLTGRPKRPKYGMKMKRVVTAWTVAALAVAALLAGCRDEDSERFPTLRIPADNPVVFGDYGERIAVDITTTDVVSLSVSELAGWQAEVLEEDAKRRIELTSPATAEAGDAEGTFVVTGYAVDGVAATTTLDVRVDLSVPPQASLEATEWSVFDPMAGESVRLTLETRYVTALAWPEENAALFPGWEVSFPDAQSVSVTPPDSYAVYAGEAAPGGLIEIEASRPTSDERAVVRIPVRLSGGLFRADDGLFAQSDVVDLTGEDQENPYVGLVCNQWVRNSDAPGDGFRSAVAYFSNDMSCQDRHTAGVVLEDGGECYFDDSSCTPGAETGPIDLLYFLTAGDGTTAASYCTYRHTDALRALCLAADADPRSEEYELLRAMLLDARPRTTADGDRHEYGMVRIGGRYWLRENLRATRLAGGGAIGLDKPGEVVEPRPDYTYCPYADDPENGATYGVLYDRAASLAEGLCPAGYELPDDDTLLRALLYAGDPMPAGAPCAGSWSGQEGDAPDLTGFAALPGGRREDDAYAGLGEELLLWTAGGLRTLRYDATETVAYDQARNPYAYVRCVKSEE